MEGVDVLSEIITKLDAEVLARQFGGTTTLRDPLEPLTAGHFARWMPPSYRSAMALVEDVRSRRGLEFEEEQENTVSAVGPLLEDPQDLDHDAKVARVMAEYHARKRAERRREQVLRWEDACALMEVRDCAASVGDVNVSRFNAAYRQRYPLSTSAERRRRALVLTPRGHMVDATVRGPNGTEFTVSRHERVGEQAIVETLMSRIEAAIPRFDWTKVHEWAEPTPNNENTAHEPPVDEDAPAQEPETDTATTELDEPETDTSTTELDEPEAVIDVAREAARLTEMVFGRATLEATDAAPEPELEDQAEAAVMEVDEPEAVVDATRMVEELMRLIRGQRKPEATDAAPVEDQVTVDATEEERLSGEPVDAEASSEAPPSIHRR